MGNLISRRHKRDRDRKGRADKMAASGQNQTQNQPQIETAKRADASVIEPAVRVESHTAVQSNPPTNNNHKQTSETENSNGAANGHSNGDAEFVVEAPIVRRKHDAQFTARAPSIRASHVIPAGEVIPFIDD